MLTHNAILLAVLLALAAAAIALKAGITAWRTRRQHQQLPVEGRPAEAQVVSRHARRFVTYRFIADRADGTPQSVTREARVRTAEYARLTEGVRVPVTYLPSNPQVVNVISRGV